MANKTASQVFDKAYSLLTESTSTTRTTIERADRLIKLGEAMAEHEINVVWAKKKGDKDG